MHSLRTFVSLLCSVCYPKLIGEKSKLYSTHSAFSLIYKVG